MSDRPPGSNEPTTSRPYTSGEADLQYQQTRRNLFKFVNTLIAAYAHEIEERDALVRECEIYRNNHNELYARATQCNERAFRAESEVATLKEALEERDRRLLGLEGEVIGLKQALEEKDRFLVMMRSARGHWKRQCERYEERYRAADGDDGSGGV